MSAVKSSGYLIQVLMDKIMRPEVVSYSLSVSKGVFKTQIWAINKSCLEADFLWVLQKVKPSLYASVFRLLSVLLKMLTFKKCLQKKGSFTMAFLSLPDIGAVLIC